MYLLLVRYCMLRVLMIIFTIFLHSLVVHSMSSKNYPNEQITPTQLYCTAENVSTDRWVRYHFCHHKTLLCILRWPSPRTGLLNLLGGAETFGKIWFACGQHEIQLTEWRMNKCIYNYMYKFTFVFLCISYAIKIYG